MSQEELAIKLSIPRPTLALYETGKRQLPRKERLYKLASFFNVSIDYLVGDQPVEHEQRLEEQITNLLKDTNIHLDHKYVFNEIEKGKITEALIEIAKMPQEQKKFALDLLIRMAKSHDK